MDISAILRCIRQCNDPVAMEQLREVFVLQNDIYTFLRTVDVPYRYEAMYARINKALSDIGTQLIKFFGG